MNTPFQRRGGFGLTTTVLIFFAVAMAQSWGIFHRADEWFSDACQRLSTRASGNHRVLLVDVPDELLVSTDHHLTELCESLIDFEPAMIGIVAEKDLPCANDLARQPWSSQLVLGLPVRQCIALQARLPSLHAGFIDLMLADQPVYRRHWSQLAVQGQTIDSLERAMALRGGLSDRELPEGVFGIRFSAGVNGLPHIDAEDVVQGKLVTELVRGRIVLIGSTSGTDNGWATPTTRGSERMSRLELHGNILESVLRRNTLQSFGVGWINLWFGWIAVVAVQTFRQCSYRWLPRLWALGMLALVVLAVAALMGWNRQLPITASIALLTTAACVGLFQRFVILNRAAQFWHLMLNVNDATDTDRDPERVWDLITDAVYQMFYPKRMALMELPSHATHLRIVKTIHCQPENIFEQRRDIQRQPYREAVDCGRPIRIANRCFFADQVDRGETEFMVPLMFASQPLGFMVLGMDTASLDRWQDFDCFLEQFAREMSILVANDRASKQEARQRKRLIGRLRQVPEEKTLTSIQHQHVDQQGEFQRIANTFEIAESALAICDVFGQIVRANSQLINLLQRVEVSVSDTSCVEMISALTGRPQHDCRRIFRTAIISKRAEQIFVPAGRLRPYACVLFIKPLLTRTSDFDGEIETRRIVIEVVEERIFHWVHRWQQQMQHRANGQAIAVARRLETELLAPTPSADHRDTPPFGSAIQSTLSELTQILEQCRRAVDHPMSDDPEQVIELDVRALVEATHERISASRRQREIECQLQVEPGDYHIVANPLLLERLLAAIWDLLYRSANRGSTLLASATALDAQIALEFVARGGDSPIEGLRKSLTDSIAEPCASVDDPSSQLVLSRPDQERLNLVREFLHAWGGSLRGRLRADGGMHFQLILRRNLERLDATGTCQQSGSGSRDCEVKA